LRISCRSFDADRQFSGRTTYCSCKCNADRKSLWRVPMVHALLISVGSRYCINIQYYDWLLTSNDEVHFFVILLLPSLITRVADVLIEVAGLALASGERHLCPCTIRTCTIPCTCKCHYSFDSGALHCFDLAPNPADDFE
jgi:hypothetical protein